MNSMTGLLRKNKSPENQTPEMSSLYLSDISYEKIHDTIEFNYGWQKNGSTYTADPKLQATVPADAMKKAGLVAQETQVPSMVMIDDFVILVFQDNSQVTFNEGFLSYHKKDVIDMDYSKNAKISFATNKEDRKRARRKERWDAFETAGVGFLSGLLRGR
jgi:hypothetical protein